MMVIKHDVSNKNAFSGDPGVSFVRRAAALTVLALLVMQTLFIPAAAQVKPGAAQTLAPLVSTTVVISQFQVAGGNAADEFLELHNVGNAQVDLNGFRLVYRSAAGTSDVAVTDWTTQTLIPAGGFYLVTNTVGYDDTVTADRTFTSGGTGQWSGTSGGLALRQGAANSGTIIDSVGYGSATNAFVETAATTSPASNTSKVRDNSGCKDTDSNSIDFVLLNPSAPRNSAGAAVICGGGTTTTNPSGTGAANPASVTAGSATLLSVTVTPGTNPASTGITVSADLTSIGGAAAQQFFDDGTNGDAAAGDNIFSYNATVTAVTTAGTKTLPATITDAQMRTGTASISLSVTSSSTPPTGAGSASPNSVEKGSATLLTVSVTPGASPVSTGITVTGDLSSIGGAAAQQFFDNGTNGDVTAGDNIFSFNATVGASVSTGGKTLPVTVADAQARVSNTTIALTVTAPPPTAQSLPFSQNWSNTNLITSDNDWSNVPGIIGYRGDNLTGTTGTDPQTILADGSATPVNVIANQTNPDTVTSGGLDEFEISNPVVGFQGSGTASAPNLVINVNTTGQNNITVSYNLRDIDGSTDNAVQPVALQYRVGNSGAYTNVPAAFVADASTGPSLATLVTPVAVALPAAVSNQPLVQLRIITSNAVGNDEIIGIDDIVVASGGTLPLSASGSASPNTVNVGDSSLLTVSVNPATNPTSTGITVTGDLSSIGGSAAQQFFDDGTNGDDVAGDNVFSFLADLPTTASSGAKTLNISVADAQARTASATISLTVIAAANSQEHLLLGNPTNATTDAGNPFNYLLSKNQYAIGYHRDRGIPNWVSWHLDSTWIGSAGRQNDFRPDPSLPAGWYQVKETDYSGSGFDRGHHTPSGDRTRSVPDNSATFFMTNMMPQAPGNNQGPWEKLESDSRSIVGQGNELYIVAGGTGIGGTGDNGGVTTTLQDGKITVPSMTWKVIVILPVGDNDVSRVTTATRTIAVIMPNNTSIRPDAWQKYLATVDQVESLTGYDFFSNVPVNIQSVIESRLDAASQAASPQPVAAGTYANLDVTDTPNKTLTGNITVTGNLNLGGTNLATGGFCVTLAPGATVTRSYGYVNNCVVRQFTSVPAKPEPALSGIGIQKDKPNAAAAAVTYPVGTDNGYSPVSVNVTALGQSPSSLTVRAVQGVQPNAPDPNLALKRYWTLTEAGDLTADLTFNYLDKDVPVGVSENNLTLQKYEGAFTTIPATIDPVANTATANNISQFSDWTLLAPAGTTAAGANIGGRILTANGRGIAGATVTLTDAKGDTFTARTNGFGYYRFSDIPSGGTYIADVRHKSYRFTPQIVNLTDNLDDLNFTGFSGK